MSNKEVEEQGSRRSMEWQETISEHLKVVRSVFYKHVSDARRKKLDDKSETMILVSYHNTGGYRLFNLISEKIIIVRYIIISDNEAWNWTSNNINIKPLLNSFIKEEKEEVDSYDALPDDMVENVPEVNQRPQRKRMPLERLQDCEVIIYN